MNKVLQEVGSLMAKSEGQLRLNVASFQKDFSPVAEANAAAIRNGAESLSAALSAWRGQMESRPGSDH